LHHAIEQFAQQQNSFISMMIPTLLNLVLGFIIGGIVVLLVKMVAKLRGVSH
jgi:predicted DNA repair protein MutK